MLLRITTSLVSHTLRTELGNKLEALRNAALYSGLKLSTQDEINSVRAGHSFLFEDNYIKELTNLIINVTMLSEKECAKIALLIRDVTLEYLEYSALMPTDSTIRK